jgi:transglutaminase-like putative cysteine protease
MKRIQITHRTAYYYKTPVILGAHRALVRPREGHDVHIESSLLEIEPQADVRWLRDIYGNSIAVLTFAGPTQKLSLFSEVVVAHYGENPLDFLIDPNALSYPFQYSTDEQIELIPYRLASYPRDGAALCLWLSDLYTPGQLISTFELLNQLNTRIHKSFQYAGREEPGVQTPAETIALGTGSCRDYAVLLMEAARQWGFGARFVTGYIQMERDQHGATHAWTEIYIPGAGWRGFDPTNNNFAGEEHVSIAVARDAEKASPLCGAWEGPADAFDRMEVTVKVVQV